MSVDRCIRSTWIPTDKPYVDREGNLIHLMKVGCGKCTFCQRSIKLDWVFRMQEEQRLRLGEEQAFITLTYEDMWLAPPWYGKPRRKKSETKTAAKRRQKAWERHSKRSRELLLYDDIQLYMKKVRKAQRGSKHGIKMFCVAEYGSNTWRPHWHMILWGNEIEDVEKYWQWGFAQKKELKMHHIQYVVDYLNKDEYPEIMKSNPLFTGKAQFRRMSQGIGENYKKRISDQDKEEYLHTGELTVVNDQGVKHQLPRYYTQELRKRLTENEDFELSCKILTRTEEILQKKELERLCYGISPKQWHFKNLRDNERKRKKYNKSIRETSEQILRETKEEHERKAMGHRDADWYTGAAYQRLLRQYKELRPRGSNQRPGKNEPNQTTGGIQQASNGNTSSNRETKGAKPKPNRNENIKFNDYEQATESAKSAI